MKELISRRRSPWKALGLAAILLIVCLVGSLFVPVPPLQGIQPLRALTDKDSRFIEVNHISVHYKDAGQGELAVILFHGLGLSTFSWREVIQPLAEHSRVIAFDLPGFGLTGRPMPGEWTGESPYSLNAQVTLTTGLMDQLGIQKAILVGSSAGGPIAMRTVLAAPDRAAALVLVDPAAVYGEPPGWVFSWMSLPQMRHLGPWALRSLGGQGQQFIESTWHNPSLITAEIWAGYERPLHVQNWDRALWEYGAATRPSELVERLDQLALPVLIVVGADDRIVPLESQQKLHQAIPGSRLVIIPACGHLPQEECPEEFMAAINAFLSTLDIW